MYRPTHVSRPTEIKISPFIVGLFTLRCEFVTRNVAKRAVVQDLLCKGALKELNNCIVLEILVRPILF